MNVSVLLVEDDTAARLSLATILARAGYVVTSAADGTTALNLLSQQPFDIVVADIQLGDADGLQVLHASKQQDEPPAVILLTGYGSLQTAIEALRAGAVDYLLKPCEPAQLLASIERAFQRRVADLYQTEAARIFSQGITYLRQRGLSGDPGSAEAVFVRASTAAPHGGQAIVVGELYIGRSRHAVTFEGRSLHLTPVEYALLRCLATVQGEVLSYRAIVQCTHEYDITDGEAQVLIKAHIHNLRRKLAPDYLVNIRGTGYKLVAPDAAAS